MSVGFVNVDPESVIRSAFELPMLPQSAVRLAGLVANNDFDLAEIEQVITCDPTLTLKLLRIANSIVSSASRPIGNVKDAVIRLGTGAVLGLAIGSCVKPALGNVIPGYRISHTDFWTHSLSAAITTESVRSFTRFPVPTLAFTTALLHDIGKVVLGQCLDSETLQYLIQAAHEGGLSSYRAEQEILTLTHADVGGVIAQHWGLPEVVTKGIAFHHEPEKCDDSIAHLIHFSNVVAHLVAPAKSGDAFDSENSPPDDVSEDLDQLELSNTHMKMILQAVRDRYAAVASEFK